MRRLCKALTKDVMELIIVENVTLVVNVRNIAVEFPFKNKLPSVAGTKTSLQHEPPKISTRPKVNRSLLAPEVRFNGFAYEKKRCSVFLYNWSVTARELDVTVLINHNGHQLNLVYPDPDSNICTSKSVDGPNMLPELFEAKEDSCKSSYWLYGTVKRQGGTWC